MPTLVVHRVGDQPVRVGHGRYIAERIQGAKYVELPGADHIPFMGDVDALLNEVREFLTGERAAPEIDRVLATILFCDIVDSTARAAEIGDRAWKDVLAKFYAVITSYSIHYTKLYDEQVDLRDKAGVCRVVEQHGITHVMHLAAESHVDRSITGPGDFIQTNVVGTFNLQLIFAFFIALSSHEIFVRIASIAPVGG